MPPCQKLPPSWNLAGLRSLDTDTQQQPQLVSKTRPSLSGQGPAELGAHCGHVPPPPNAWPHMADDQVLVVNLFLLGIQNSSNYPALRLQEQMFKAPNSTAAECIFHFLMCRLRGDVAESEMSEFWPPKDHKAARAFRTYAGQQVAQHASEWGVTPELARLFASQLQKATGEKLKRVFCELSFAALRSHHQRRFPQDKSVDPLVGDPFAGDPRTREALGLHAEPLLAVAAAKVEVQRDQFLRKIGVAKGRRKRWRAAADRLIQSHGRLASKPAYLLERIPNPGAHGRGKAERGAYRGKEVAKAETLWRGVEEVLQQCSKLKELSQMAGLTVAPTPRPQAVEDRDITGLSGGEGLAGRPQPSVFDRSFSSPSPKRPKPGSKETEEDSADTPADLVALGEVWRKSLQGLQAVVAPFQLGNNGQRDELLPFPVTEHHRSAIQRELRSHHWHKEKLSDCKALLERRLAEVEQQEAEAQKWIDEAMKSMGGDQVADLSTLVTSLPVV